MIVAFRSAKVAHAFATFAEQKATVFAALTINSPPRSKCAVDGRFAERLQFQSDFRVVCRLSLRESSVDNAFAKRL